jgi:hypothetical protein
MAAFSVETRTVQDGFGMLVCDKKESVLKMMDMCQNDTDNSLKRFASPTQGQFEH